ncbi:hypothetical protein DLM76_17785 [Leptospira yasudae]|nr:hypothetical protein DLM76_17785 [Leptospira yasudae]
MGQFSFIRKFHVPQPEIKDVVGTFPIFGKRILSKFRQHLQIKVARRDFLFSAKSEIMESK